MQSEDDDNNGAVEVAGINIETEMNRDKFPQKARKIVVKALDGQRYPCSALVDCG